MNKLATTAPVRSISSPPPLTATARMSSTRRWTLTSPSRPGTSNTSGEGLRQAEAGEFATAAETAAAFGRQGGTGGHHGG